jgi:phage tail-like protein
MRDTRRSRDREEIRMSPKPTRSDPYTRFNFRVQLDGVDSGAFSEVSGLDSVTEVIEYRTGDSTTTSSVKLPGLTKYPNIVLKRGITRDLSLWQWRKTVVDGNTDRRNGAIILLDEARKEVLRWTFRNGWPAKWEGPDLDASSSEVAIETIEIAHEGLELESA